MKQATRIAKNTGFLYARMAITVFISLYSTRLVLAALGATDFGIFNVVAGAIAMLAFLNAAMTQATQRFMSYAEGKGDFNAQVGIFNVSILLHLIIGFAVVLVLEIAAYYLFNGILEIPENRMSAAKVIYQCMVASTLFKIISVPYDAVINAHENMFLVAILGVLEAILKLVIAVYITYTDFDSLISYGFLMALMSVVLLIIRRIYCHKKYKEVKINLRKHYNKKLFNEMGSFAGWSFLGSSSSILANYGQGIVLNMFFGPRVNASQGIANQINGQLSSFSTTMLSALNPAIAKNEGAGNRVSMLKMTAMGSKMSFFLLAIMCIPVLIEMPYILNLWLKDVPEYAIIFCRLLIIRTLIEQISIPISTSIRAVGKIRGFQITSAILNFFPLLAVYLFFKNGYPPYSIYYVFITYALINTIIILWYARIHTGLNIPIFLNNVILRCFITFTGAITLGITVSLMIDETFIRLLITTILSVIITLVLMNFVGFDNDERGLIKNLAKSFYSKIKFNKK